MSLEDQTETLGTEESIVNQLTQLKRSMAGFLAHRISFTLFETGKNDLLKHTLEHLVTERLAEQHISLEPELKTRLIEEIYSGFPVKKSPVVETSDSHSLEKLRPLVASYMAHYLSNDLLRPGHEKALARKIQTLVQEKLALDHIDIGEEKTFELIKTLCESLNVDPPPHLPAEPIATKEPDKGVEQRQTPATAQPSQEDHVPLNTLIASPQTPLPPPQPKAFSFMTSGPNLQADPSKLPSAASQTPQPPEPVSQKDKSFPQPPVPPEKSPTKKVPRLSLKAKKIVEGKEFEDLDFTEEHKRELLLNLGARLDPSIMSSGDTKLVYKHIMDVLALVCDEENLELDDDIKELLLNGILSGDGLEFQL